MERIHFPRSENKLCIAKMDINENVFPTGMVFARSDYKIQKRYIPLEYFTVTSFYF